MYAICTIRIRCGEFRNRLLTEYLYYLCIPILGECTEKCCTNTGVYHVMPPTDLLCCAY